MRPGRSSFMKTGRGIPSPFLQEQNKGTGEDLRAQAKKLAEAKLQKQMDEAGQNPGDAGNIRNFKASATVTVPGKKVEKQAKTPEEIEAWKKAPKENKEKYESKSVTETASASDKGYSMGFRLQPKGPVSIPVPITAPLPSADELTRRKVTKKDLSTTVSRMSYNKYVENPSKGFQKPGLSFDDWDKAEKERTMKNARNNPEPKETKLYSSKSRTGCPGGCP